MKIFTAKQIKEWDDFTIHHDKVSSISLMERTAKNCAEWFVQKFRKNEPFLIFCGNGNNGGDGFAIARVLYEKGYDVTVFCDQEKKFSPDAALNLKKCKSISGIDIRTFSEVGNLTFKDNSVIIDALFGIGLDRNITGSLAELITELNKLNYCKISIDLPSGLMADEIITENAVVFKADYTLTFQSWKKSLLHPETGIYSGEVIVLNINLNQNFSADEPSKEFIINENLIHTIYQPRKEFTHKGTFGKTMIIAGTFGKIGAAVLATKAALKAGSGLTFIVAPKCGFAILQSICPEAMFISGGEDEMTNFNLESDAVLGIGPGLGIVEETEKHFLEFLKKYQKPLVLDADALNILSKNKNYLKNIPTNSIITPHPKEFDRLFGTSENSFDRLNVARKYAAELKIYIVLKDHHTQVITPDDRIFYNNTGNSGMAKGGSGDALLGIITSLLAQGYSSENAAILGVWIHGKAGDFAAAKYSKESMLPSDLITELGNVFKFLV